MYRLFVLLWLPVGAILLGCDGGSSGSGASTDPEQVIFHFKMIGDGTGVQDFRAATDNPDVIGMARAQLQLEPQARRLFIIGALGHGNGGHNLEWNWHFLPSQWRLTEVAAELCDGNAVIVNQAVEYWVDKPGGFCPWGSYVAGEVNIAQ